MDSAIDIAARASHREALRYLRAAPGLLLAGALRGLAAGGLTPRRRTTRRRGECAERRRRELEECRRARAIYGLAQAPRDEATPGVLVFRPAAAPRHPYALEMSR